MSLADLPDRIAAKIEIDDRGCWAWTGSKTKGYAYVYWQGGPRRAVRLVYELLVGAIPDGLQLDHRCRNRGCVNPEHVEPVTQQVNIERGNAGLENNVQTQKTHCPKGHPYAGENLLELPGNRRGCRTCRKESNRKLAAKRKRQRREKREGVALSR